MNTPKRVKTIAYLMIIYSLVAGFFTIQSYLQEPILKDLFLDLTRILIFIPCAIGILLAKNKARLAFTALQAIYFLVGLSNIYQAGQGQVSQILYTLYGTFAITVVIFYLLPLVILYSDISNDFFNGDSIEKSKIKKA